MSIIALQKEAKTIHSQIMTQVKLTLQMATKLGGILLRIKEELGHGKFEKWVETQTHISMRAAQNYMSLDKNKDLLKKEKIETLTDAYKYVANFKNNMDTKKRTERREKRAAFANQDTKFTNPDGYENKTLCGDNIKVMSEMLKKGMAGKYSVILTSPPYNNSLDYGKYSDDNLPYQDYLNKLLSAFPLYSKLLRSGGRIVMNLGNMIKNEERHINGDYNHQILTDLKYEVREQFKEIKHYTDIIWDKGAKGRNPLKTQYGSYMSPVNPLCRSCHENIIVWAKDKFDLENIEGTTPDITKEEYNICSWSVWTIAPYIPAGSLHQCSYPKKLVELLLKFYSSPNDMVLDPFCGQGTTGTVCKSIGRRFTQIDINPNYASLAKKVG